MYEKLFIYVAYTISDWKPVVCHLAYTDFVTYMDSNWKGFSKNAKQNYGGRGT